MADLFTLAGPLLRCLDPETAHGLAITALKCGLVPGGGPVSDPVLKVSLWGREFANPLGLAAGFDKNGDVPDAMLKQGFGFVEIGSVTPRPQDGNPRPRLFRLSRERAVINRMGFNNHGQEVVAERLAGRANLTGGHVGINIGKNKDTTDPVSDYVAGAAALAGLADYLVINVSSPNTPGLRALQGKEPLAQLIAAVREAVDGLGLERPPPVLIKVAPDLTDEDKHDIAEVVTKGSVDGLIATNTTIERPSGLSDPARREEGGLSGNPLFEPSTRVLSEFYELTGGKLPLVGVGGVSSGADAYAKIRAGASLVQLYSALVFHGPGLVRRINRELAELLKADGFTSVANAVGADHR